jgi:serine protease Do
MQNKEANAATTTATESGTLTTEEVAANAMPAMVAITNKSVSEVQNYFGGFDLFGSGTNNASGRGQGQTQETTSRS